MNVITDQKIGETMMTEKTLEKKRIFEKKNTKHLREKEHDTKALMTTKRKQVKKEKSIQRIEIIGIRSKNKFIVSRSCRFCNAPNWSPLHKCRIRINSQ